MVKTIVTRHLPFPADVSGSDRSHAAELLLDDPAHFLLDAVVVPLYLFPHMVLAVPASKVRNHGDRFVGFRLAATLALSTTISQ